MDDIVIIENFAFNVTKVISIFPHALYLSSGETMATDLGKCKLNCTATFKTGVERVPLTNEGFHKIIHAIQEAKQLKLYKERVKKLELHISLMEGGSEYLLAQSHFQSQ